MKHDISFRELVALIIMGLFGWAFFKSPSEPHIVGALLTAFAASWGFYLGGSKTGSDTAAKNADTVAAQAAQATDTASSTPRAVEVVNADDNPVPVQPKEK